MAGRQLGIGGHQSANADTTTWLTPPSIIEALGSFDLDPCAAPEPRPWPTAARHITWPEDGLTAEWSGRVWCNPPYGAETAAWLQRMAKHGDGIALVFARTETAMFTRWVWGAADSILFLHGRLHFHHADGSRAAANAGGPSCLVAYNPNDTDALRRSGLPGSLVTGWQNTMTTG